MIPEEGHGRKGRDMRRFLMIFALLMMICRVAAAEEITGTWSGGMEDGGVRVLTVVEDGTGVLTENGTEQKITWDEAHQVYADGEKIASLMLQDGFLIFRDASDEVWPLMRNETQLSGIIHAKTESEFYGVWKADYAVVSGFRIPMEEVEITYSIEQGKAICSGSGYKTPIPLPTRLSEGSLVIQSSQPDMEVVLSLREDGSMTRDMTYMTVHFSR